MMSLINSALLRAHLAMSDLRARLSVERGQDLLEYALLGGFIALAIVTGFFLFDDALTTMTGNIADCIDFDGATTCDPGP